MIFSAITSTPCLALDNKSRKISGVFNWLKHLGYVKVCSSPEQLIDSINEYRNIKTTGYDNSEVLEKFGKLKPFLMYGEYNE